MITDKHIIATPGKTIRLADYDTAYRSHYMTKKYALEHLKEEKDKLKTLQIAI